MLKGGSIRTEESHFPQDLGPLFLIFWESASTCSRSHFISVSTPQSWLLFLWLLEWLSAQKPFSGQLSLVPSSVAFQASLWLYLRHLPWANSNLLSASTDPTQLLWDLCFTLPWFSSVLISGSKVSVQCCGDPHASAPCSVSASALSMTPRLPITLWNSPYIIQLSLLPWFLSFCCKFWNSWCLGSSSLGPFTCVPYLFSFSLFSALVFDLRF